MQNSILEVLRYFNFRSKLTQFYLFLLILVILGLAQSYNDNLIFINSLFSIIFFNLIGITYCIIKRHFYNDKLTNPNNILISINIIFLIIHQIDQNSNHSFLAQLLIIIILLIVKEINLLRLNGFPIFNPAAISIFLYFLIFDRNMSTTFVSWWGANIYKNFLEEYFIQFFVSFIILLVLTYFSISFKRIYYSIVFLFTYFFIQTLITITAKESYLVIQNFNTIKFIIDLVASYYQEITSMIGFFVLVMLTEPKTTPNRKYTQLFYGFTSAIIYIILNNTKYYTNHDLILLDDTEIITILVSNFLFFIQKLKFKK